MGNRLLMLINVPTPVMLNNRHTPSEHITTYAAPGSANTKIFQREGSAPPAIPHITCLYNPLSLPDSLLCTSSLFPL